VLIDWEFAAPGDALFDLAVVVQHHELGNDLAGVLLQAYLGRPPTTTEQSRFGAQRAFYRDLLSLWNLRLRDL
jgi:thiamine kinase-like enzyme